LSNIRLSQSHLIRLMAGLLSDKNMHGCVQSCSTCYKILITPWSI